MNDERRLRATWIIFAKGEFRRARKSIQQERLTGRKGWYCSQIQEHHKEARWYLSQARKHHPEN